MQFFLTVIVLASTYALLASGIVVLYKSTRILNFAHGELAIIGGYVFLTVSAFSGGSIWLAAAAIVVFSCLVGSVIYLLLMRQLVGQPFYIGILATLGIAIVAKAVVIVVWKGRATSLLLGGNTALFSFSDGSMFSLLDAATIGAAVVFYSLLYVFVTYTRLGIQFRGTAENPLLASQRGVNVNLVLSVAWAIAVFAASLAGILYGGRAVLSLQVVAIGLSGLTAALVGGMDSLRGAVVGALIIALAEYATIRYVDPILSEAIPFVILLLVMLWRPWGIFGTREEIERV